MRWGNATPQPHLLPSRRPGPSVGLDPPLSRFNPPALKEEPSFSKLGSVGDLNWLTGGSEEHQSPVVALMSPSWWGPQQRILQQWFKKTISYKVQVIPYQNNSNKMGVVSCSASENRRLGRCVGKGPRSHLWLGPCLAARPSLWAWGQLGGCPTEGNHRIISEMLWCTQVFVLALQQCLVGCAELSLCCADCHPPKKASVSFSSSSGSAYSGKKSTVLTQGWSWVGRRQNKGSLAWSTAQHGTADPGWQGWSPLAQPSLLLVPHCRDAAPFVWTLSGSLKSQLGAITCQKKSQDEWVFPCWVCTLSQLLCYQIHGGRHWSCARGRAALAELYPVCMRIESRFYFRQTLRTADLLRMLWRSFCFFFLLVFYCNLAWDKCHLNKKADKPGAEASQGASASPAEYWIEHCASSQQQDWGWESRKWSLMWGVTSG